jgi:hypothetical protein
VGSALPIRKFAAGEFEVGLVDEHGGPEGLGVAFVAEIVGGETA